MLSLSDIMSVSLFVSVVLLRVGRVTKEARAAFGCPSCEGDGLQSCRWEIYQTIRQDRGNTWSNVFRSVLMIRCAFTCDDNMFICSGNVCLWWHVYLWWCPLWLRPSLHKHAGCLFLVVVWVQWSAPAADASPCWMETGGEEGESIQFGCSVWHIIVSDVCDYLMSHFHNVVSLHWKVLQFSQITYWSINECWDISLHLQLSKLQHHNASY